MGVDLCRAHITVTELLLDRADVCAAGEQVGGETMSQSMAANRMGNFRPARRVAHGALHRARMEMVEPHYAFTRIAAWSRGGEHKLPAPGRCRVRVLARQCPGHRHRRDSCIAILFVNQTPGAKMAVQRFMQHIGHSHYPILATLAGSNNQGAMLEIKILDSQGLSLRKTQP